MTEDEKVQTIFGELPQSTIDQIVRAHDDWTCQHCQRSYVWFAVRKTVWLTDQPNEALTICAACHKQLYREKKIAKEAI